MVEEILREVLLKTPVQYPIKLLLEAFSAIQAYGSSDLRKQR